MIVSNEELAEVARAIGDIKAIREQIVEAEDEGDYDRSFDLEDSLPDVEDRLLSFVDCRPHLLLPLGFDEFHAVPCELGVPLLPRNRVPHVAFATFDFSRETFFRKPGGSWSWFEGVTNFRKDDGPESEAGWYVHTVDDPAVHTWTPVEDWLKALEREAATPDDRTSSLLLPSLWTPAALETRDLQLTSAVSGLLQGFRGEGVDLRSVHWRDLEELVAELLRAQGLQVQVTPRSADGGRDILARGELVPGEPTTLAVEVKQMAVVGVDEIRSALYANRKFPIVLMATAGRFSAGVLRERGHEDNRLRLLLKDGVALSQWISAYPFRWR